MRKMYSLNFLQNLIKNTKSLFDDYLFYSEENELIIFDTLTQFSEGAFINFIGNQMYEIDINEVQTELSEYYDSENQRYNVPLTNEYVKQTLIYPFELVSDNDGEYNLIQNLKVNLKNGTTHLITDYIITYTEPMEIQKVIINVTNYFTTIEVTKADTWRIKFINH